MQTNYVKINSTDLRSLNKKLKNLRQLDKRGFSKELGTTALDIVRMAQKNVVVDKGALKQSIRSEVQNKNASIVAGAKYAPYVEFGTGRYVDLTDLTELGIPESYAAQFKGKGIKEVNLPARPFFYNSARIGLKNLLIRLNERIKKSIK